jgi:hypothetical protein
MPSLSDSAAAVKCNMVIESDVVMVSRKIPPQLLGMNALFLGVEHAGVDFLNHRFDRDFLLLR